ncbi:MAG: MoaD/ThiS family protein [Pseudomonadota bacterium]|nr:MoaD/ThiS family protein [Pseudomonadota bacterium]
MKEVRVIFFASLREEVGCDEIAVQAGSLNELLDELRRQLSETAIIALTAENVRIAVNQMLVDGVVDLQPGDEVAFLPPVTGG